MIQTVSAMNNPNDNLITPDAEIIHNEPKCHFCAEELDVEKFLSVNGPEIAYEFGDALMKAAMNDINALIDEFHRIEREEIY